MSPPKSSNDAAGGTYRKPRADLYTILLVIALLAILTAILFLYLHMQSYNFELKGSPPPPMASIATRLMTWISAFGG